MNILFETDQLIMKNEFESTFLIDKSTGMILLKVDFFGDPMCGLIDKENKWAIIAGEHLTIWSPEKCKIIDDENLIWIHSIRIKDSETVEILTDPWNIGSSIWEINTKTFEFKEIRGFEDYKGKEYSEIVKW